MDGIINAVDPPVWDFNISNFFKFLDVSAYLNPQFLDVSAYLNPQVRDSLNAALNPIFTVFISAIGVFVIGSWGYRRIMKEKKDDDDNNRRGNQAVQPFIENASEDVDKKTVKVELRNGVCYVERGEDQSMAAKCNAALQEMNDFQRQFLATVPEGQPNKLLFTEEIRRNTEGATKTSFYFTNRKKETSGILSPLYSLKSKVWN